MFNKRIYVYFKSNDYVLGDNDYNWKIFYWEIEELNL